MRASTQKALDFLRVLITGALISAVVAAVICAFSNAKIVSTTFFVWAALFLNANIATWEDAAPGGFDNPDGKENLIPKGWAKFWFWSATALGCIMLAFIGWLLTQHGL